MAKSKDPVEIAKDIFDDFLSRHDPDSVTEKPPKAKDVQAQEAGRLGGLKGGRARAKKLSPQERKKIAKKAADARWAKS